MSKVKRVKWIMNPLKSFFSWIEMENRHESVKIRKRNDNHK